MNINNYNREHIQDKIFEIKHKKVIRIIQFGLTIAIILFLPFIAVVLWAIEKIKRII